MATETSGWHWDGRAGVGTPGTGTSVYLQNGEGVGGVERQSPAHPVRRQRGRAGARYFLALMREW